MTFGERLKAAFDATGRLCVGIDPHSALLSEWGLPDTAVGVREFGLRVVDAAAGRAGIVKPQVAFFERHGSAGYAALEDVLAAARAAGLIVIADVKRGDVGSTVEAYGQAWLTPGSPLEADAMTVVAYQGAGSLDEVMSNADDAGKGLFVLAATSNPEGILSQQAVRIDGRTVAREVVDWVSAWNESTAVPDSASYSESVAADGAVGLFGVVIGATIALTDFGITENSLAGLPILAPGFGAQGARIAQLPELFGSAAQNVLVSASRSILSAGPGGIAAAIDAHNAEVAACHV